MRLIVAITIAILIYLIQNSLYRRLWSRRLTVDIGFEDEYIMAGGSSCLVETISNAKLLPLPVLHVKFSAPRCFIFKDRENASVTDLYHRNDVFSIMGNQRITRKLAFTAEKRGLYNISGVNIIVRDFFMTRSFAKSVKSNAGIYVFPRRYKDVELNIVLNAIFGELESRRRLIEDPYTFRGIRDYDLTDNMSRINWKATAKTDRLMVNVYNCTSEQTVKLMLNMDTNSMIRTEYLQEISIEITGTVAEYMLNHSIPVMLMSNGTDIVTEECGRVNAGAAMNHMVTIDKYLSRIDKDAGIDSFMSIVDGEINQSDTNATYVVVSAYYKDELLLKLDYMRSIGMDVHMIVPYYDIQDFVRTRDYMHGLEVKLVET